MKARRVVEFGERIRSVGGNTDVHDFHDTVTNGFVFRRTSHSVSAPCHHKGLEIIRVFDGELCEATMFPSWSHVIKLPHNSL